MEIVIEILEPGRKASQILKFTQPQIRVGRAWDNDLVLTDAEIDAYHGIIDYDEQAQQLRFTDLNSSNGSVYKGKRVSDSQTIEFAEKITLGETNFKIHRQSDTVAPTKLHSSSEKLTKTLGRPVYACLLALCAISLGEYFDFIEGGIKFEWNIQLQSLISSSMTLVVWALVWGGISKLIKHHMNFFAHLALASCVMIISGVLGQLGNVIVFNTLSAWITDLYDASNTALVVFIWMYFALVITANARARTRLGVACVAVGLYLLTNYLLPRFQEPVWVANVPLETASLPPQYMLRDETPVADFLDAARENIQRSSENAVTKKHESTKE
ncbi:FHA domain-containing protein [Alteromonas sp. ASW11-36]|uniref:FHA domain-containing protein n=1 Tax=Alteromonas arenosi TaxID=3055817 RepID=A0ABT7SXN2_9ALTE|nr:FHA domain-containing protein [Alteromonas sp. ASW11-36]MDM7860949.1 FHA domain-containing protein [Alteromonas sp. ASW11-36]